ncbi:MAG: HAMP domain-containing sensor histidine kinase [Alistipes sp.]
MSFLRQTVLIGSFLLGIAATVSAQQPVEDSLRRVLADTDDPAKRVEILLNLKDLNEETVHNLPYSIQLFREAAAIGNTHALAASIIAIVNRYANFDEQQDSLKSYVNTLRRLTPGTPEEGTDTYAEMVIIYKRMNSEPDRKRTVQLAYEALHWCDSVAQISPNIYRQTACATLSGYANVLIDYFEKGEKKPFMPQIELWKQAYDNTFQMPQVSVQERFAHFIYFLLSSGYNQAHQYAELVTLTNRHIKLLDQYYADDSQRCRPYFYTDNSYVIPYQQLMMCAKNIGHKDLIEYHFDAFRQRMLHTSKANLNRNKTYIYETGYRLRGNLGAYKQAVQYCDSLINLIESGQGYYRMKSDKILRVYRDRGRLLYQNGNYAKAAVAYQRTVTIQDSLNAAERIERTKTIRQSHEMDRLKLKKTRNQIHNQTAATVSFMAIGIFVLSIGGYLYRSQQRDRRLQFDILLHNRKAHESEEMKSTFINTICAGIGPPMEVIDQRTRQLIALPVNSDDRLTLLDSIRANTAQLLSALDNMLEAANLRSLTEGLQLRETDINALCHEELLFITRQRLTKEVAFSIETPDTQSVVRTNAKYFSIVIRTLLNNANKFTKQGHITLHHQLHPQKNQLVITVTDTGCGIPSSQHEEIFKLLPDHSSSSRGVSLALCSLIAKHLSGSIRLDTSYTQGARFIFIIPIQL